MRKATFDDIRAMLRSEGAAFFVHDDGDKLVFLITVDGAPHPVFLKLEDSYVLLACPLLPCPDRGSDRLATVEREVLETGWALSIVRVSRDPEDNELRADYRWPLPDADVDPEELDELISEFMEQTELLIQRINEAAATGKTSRDREIEAHLDSMCGCVDAQPDHQGGDGPSVAVRPVHRERTTGPQAESQSASFGKGDAILLGATVSVLGAAGYSFWLGCRWIAGVMHEAWVAVVG